jgi:hypothetical protein
MQICRRAGGFHLTFFLVPKSVSVFRSQSSAQNKHKHFKIAALKDLKSGLAVIAVKANCWKSRRNHKPFADETALFRSKNTRAAGNGMKILQREVKWAVQLKHSRQWPSDE